MTGDWSVIINQPNFVQKYTLHKTWGRCFSCCWHKVECTSTISALVPAWYIFLFPILLSTVHTWLTCGTDRNTIVLRKLHRLMHIIYNVAKEILRFVWLRSTCIFYNDVHLCNRGSSTQNTKQRICGQSTRLRISARKLQWRQRPSTRR